MIDWLAFLLVLLAALIGASVVVSAYSLGIRLLTISGRTPVVTPAEFTDAITVITPAEAKAAAKRAAKAARKSPLTEGQKRVSFLGAVACFAVSAISVIVGIWLIVGEHLAKALGLA
ncbi:peptidase [Agromyces sp. MMS24-JH15]|uniref:peptidase n=1 Tax=Agromyces sp. MMS24-JH15 TaxID=3243765 RepID=UPI00374936B7